ncbi:MAG: TRAP transporter small permease [Pseudomonadota bacterium]
MAAEASVPEDDSAVSRADRALYRVESALGLLAGLTILAVMLVSVANILGRWLFELPVPGFVDWMEQAVPIIAFFALAYCQRLGGHIRMDLLVGQLRGRALYLAELLGTFFILFLTVFLIWGAWLHFGRSFDWGSPNWSRDSTIDIGLPIWPIKLVVPVMLALFALRLVLQLWAYTKAIRENPEFAVAVPKIESAAEQAEAEAETVSGAEDDEDDEDWPKETRG